MRVMDEVAPVLRSVTVNASQERAFQVFTAEIASWWPTYRYSIGEDKVADVVMEPRAGGRIYERWHDGSERSWGEVLTWDPTDRLVLAWKPNELDVPPTEVEVTFRSEGSQTVVELEHRGWERLGALASEAKTGYDSDTGWTWVLGLFAERI